MVKWPLTFGDEKVTAWITWGMSLSPTFFRKEMAHQQHSWILASEPRPGGMDPGVGCFTWRFRAVSTHRKSGPKMATEETVADEKVEGVDDRGTDGLLNRLVGFIMNLGELQVSSRNFTRKPDVFPLLKDFLGCRRSNCCAIDWCQCRTPPNVHWKLWASCKMFHNRLHMQGFVDSSLKAEKEESTVATRWPEWGACGACKFVGFFLGENPEINGAARKGKTTSIAFSVTNSSSISFLRKNRGCQTSQDLGSWKVGHEIIEGFYGKWGVDPNMYNWCFFSIAMLTISKENMESNEVTHFVFLFRFKCISDERNLEHI